MPQPLHQINRFRPMCLVVTRESSFLMTILCNDPTLFLLEPRDGNNIQVRRTFSQHISSSFRVHEMSPSSAAAPSKLQLSQTRQVCWNKRELLPRQDLLSRMHAVRKHCVQSLHARTNSLASPDFEPNCKSLSNPERGSNDGGEGRKWVLLADDELLMLMRDVAFDFVLKHKTARRLAEAPNSETRISAAESVLPTELEGLVLEQVLFSVAREPSEQ